MRAARTPNSGHQHLRANTDICGLLTPRGFAARPKSSFPRNSIRPVVLVWMSCVSDFLLFALAGFVAQMIDGALGMAYGVSCTSLLLAFGYQPAAASASV